MVHLPVLKSEKEVTYWQSVPGRILKQRLFLPNVAERPTAVVGPRIDLLLPEDQSIVRCRNQATRIGEARVGGGSIEVELEDDLLGHLPSEMKQPVRPSGLGYGELEILLDDLIE
jgi:hypothetical protein